MYLECKIALNGAALEYTGRLLTMSLLHLPKKPAAFPSNVQLQKQLHRRLLRVILTWIAGVIVLSPLVSCAGLGSGTSPKTHQISRGKLIWSDEFSGPARTRPDPNKWVPSVEGHGWGNQQLEYDTDNQNTYQDGQGHLVIEARKDNPSGYQCWYGSCEYTSARLTTKKRFSFTYGLIEASIRIPRGQGLWPAFWLLGANCKRIGWPDCGEIDVMENIGNEPDTIYGSIHGPGHFADSVLQNSYVLPHGTFADGFHVFALEWCSEYLSFFVDGKQYATVTKTSFFNPQEWVYNHPFNIILNLAIGGTWPGDPSPTTVFPQKMYVAYVRLYDIAGS